MLLFIAALFGGAATWGYFAIFGKAGMQDDEGLRVHQTPAVVVAVRKLARLESAQFNVERVVDLSDEQRTLFGLLKVKDAILLVASGEVIAGVDLAELVDGDFVVNKAKRSAKITLPPPRIFSVRVDSERTYVHSRKTDLFADRKEGLEAKARQHAEQSIRKAAQEGGILDHARRNASRTVKSLVQSLGYDDVKVYWSDR
ncbi:MAG: DUF4230 domain-containing protein [Myxococcales bacterium]|nr:MAG: DUF4230 domain-containing protein [Myxococcales bacterium]